MTTVTMTRVQALSIMQAGARARADGLPPTACPYKAMTSPEERLQAAAWLRGYAVRSNLSAALPPPLPGADEEPQADCEGRLPDDPEYGQGCEEDDAEHEMEMTDRPVTFADLMRLADLEQMPPVADAIPTDGPPFHGVLAPEGVRTGDLREFKQGALRWRDLPLPLHVQNEIAPGHDGAVRVGRIDTINRDASGPVTKIRFTGVWATTSEGELTDAAKTARDEVLNGVLRGVSVDVDDSTSEFADPETGEPLGEDDFFDLFGPMPLERVLDGRICGATACSIPAFQEAYIADGEYVPGLAEPGDTQPDSQGAPAAEFAVSEKPWGDFTAADYTPEQWRDATLIHLDPAEGQDPLSKGLHKLPVFEPGGALNRAGVHAAASVLAGGRGGVDAPPDKIAAAKTRVANLYKNELGEDPPESIAGAAVPWLRLVASGMPTYEASDFANPGLDEPTPLTVTPDGRVYGHLATWGTCHIGFDGVCVTPPTSRSGYAYFTTGAVDTPDGEIPVGQITLGTGHAMASLGHRPAVEHYDNTGTAVADVAAGEDAVGIWLAGRLRPGVAPEQEAALRHGGAVSGDWRRIGGQLELVAALAVNVPGFPVPRTQASTVGGRQAALTAAAVVRGQGDGPDDGRVVARQVLAILDRRDRVERLARRVGRDRASRLAAAAALIGRE